MNDLEVKFREVLSAHKSEIDEAYAKVIALSDKYGIPFGDYVPASFEQFKGPYGPNDDWVDGVNFYTLTSLCNMSKYWSSSTAECEFYT